MVEVQAIKKKLFKNMSNWDQNCQPLRKISKNICAHVGTAI